MGFIKKIRESIIKNLVEMCLSVDHSEYDKLLIAAENRYKGNWYSNNIAIINKNTFSLTSTKGKITTIDTYTKLKLVEIREVNYRGLLHGKLVRVRNGKVTSVREYVNGKKVKSEKEE